MVLLWALLNTLGTGFVALLLILLSRKTLKAIDTLGGFSLSLEKTLNERQKPAPQEETTQAQEATGPQPDETAEIEEAGQSEGQAQESTPKPEETAQPEETGPDNLMDIRDRMEVILIELSELVNDKLYVLASTGTQELEPDLETLGEELAQEAGFLSESEDTSQGQEMYFCELKGVYCHFLTEDETCQGQCDELLQRLAAAETPPEPEPEGQAQEVIQTTSKSKRAMTQKQKDALAKGREIKLEKSKKKERINEN